MGLAVRVMGNLVTDETPTGWRGCGARRATVSRILDRRKPFS